MKQSLRQFLTFNLLLSVGFVALIAISGNVFFKYRDVKPHLDAQLSLTALNTGAALDYYHSLSDLQLIQRKINQIPQQIRAIHSDNHDMDNIIGDAVRSVQFQVWSPEGQLLLKSSHAPNVPFNPQDGFFYTTHNGSEWRVFSHTIPQTKRHVVAFQRHDIRLGFERQVIYDSILIIGLTFTLLTIAVWLIINRGLKGLDVAATELHVRDPSNLTPIKFRDMPSELEPLIQAINQLFDQLNKALDRERRFAGDAAHEIKTPIAAIKTISQTLSLSETDPQKKEMIDEIISGVNRSTHIINQLLTLSRTLPEAFKKSTHLCHINQIASDTIALLVPKAMKLDTSLHLEKPDHEVSVMGNTTSFEIIMHNLIDNAIKYSPPGSDVVVSIKENKTDVEISVSDNGGGVEEKHLEHLTKRFYRVYGNETSGSGLGLNIVIQLVELLKGQLHIENKALGGKIGLSCLLKIKKPRNNSNV